MSVASRMGMATSIETKDGIAEVREILVGAIKRDLERRITKLETNLAARAAELQQELRRRIDVVESHLGKEIETLAARVDGEVVELKDSLRALTREHRETSSASDQRAAKLEEAASHAQRELRSQLLDQAKSFLDELHQMRQDLAETIERELGPVGVESAEGTMPNEQRETSETAATH